MARLIKNCLYAMVLTSLLGCQKGAVNISELQGGSGGSTPAPGGLSAPVITPTTPPVLKVSVNSTVTFSAAVSDADGDSLSYVWRLNGAASPDLVGTSTSAVLSTSLVGAVNVTLSASDGSHVTAFTWIVDVNYFHSSCNAMDSAGETNKTCVLVGNPSVGDGESPVTSPTLFLLRPTATSVTASGDVFVADDANSVVWFWNRDVVDKTMLNVLVPAGKMKIVAGVGYSGTLFAGSGGSALRTSLGSPGALLFDGTDLYISSPALSSVVRVLSTGVVQTVLSAGCSTPRGLAKAGTTLYVACYGSNIVRSVDTLTLAAATVAGTGSAGNPVSTNESLPTVGPDAVLSGPYGLAIDAIGNLFISEFSGCRIRVLNLSGAITTLYGSWTIGSGSMRLALGNSGAPSCTNIMGEAVNLTGATDASIGQPLQISFSPEGHLLIPNTSGGVVVALNFGAASVGFLGKTILPYQINTVAGSTLGYSGEGLLATSAKFSFVSKVEYDPLSTSYLVCDANNYRLRKISSTDYKTSLLAGAGTYRHMASTNDGVVEVAQEKLASPHHMVFDPVNNLLFVADSNNNRIRMVSRYGTIAQAAGNGTIGTGSEENVLPTLSTMIYPNGLVLTHQTASFGGNLIWTDSSSHKVRFWNRSLLAATFFGVYVDAGRVATIGGDGTAGNITAGPALGSAFNGPAGLAWNSTSNILYITDSTNHCIKALDSSGNLSVVAGTCTLGGSVDGAPGVGRLSFPDGLAYYRSGASEGLFIADRGASRVRFLRLAGTGSIAGIATVLGSTVTVAGGGTIHSEGVLANTALLASPYDVATSGSNFCFVNFIYHNLRCVDIATGLIRTVMGSPQGVGTTAQYFGATSLSSSGQNGVAADSQGTLIYPIGLTFLDSQSLFVNESYMGLIRKVRLGP